MRHLLSTRGNKISEIPDLKILESTEEMSQATSELLELKIPAHHDYQKNWDLLQSINELKKFKKTAAILDAGSGTKAVFAKSAQKLGFKKIFACDLQLPQAENVITSMQDMTDTNYRPGEFDFIASHSVIEHGVDLNKFFTEMKRISSENAVLTISTDFWPTFEDHGEKYPYGKENAPMMLFNNESVKEMLEIAQKAGWKIPTYKSPQNLLTRPVYWERMDARYTFIWIKFVNSEK
jgi:SAM-dependent methyltransferase